MVLLEYPDLGNLSLKETPTCFFSTGRRQSTQCEEILIEEDVSGGRERFPVRLMSYAKDASLPDNFHYATRVVDSSNILQSRDGHLSEYCMCGDICTTSDCGCRTVQYGSDGRAPLKQLREFVYECNAYCKCSLQCGNRVAQKGATCPVEIFSTRTKGWGVRTQRLILKGTFIGEYTGEVRKDGDGCGEYLFETRMGAVSCTIDASNFGNFTRFINHSCAANLHAASVIWDTSAQPFVHICFFATRTIREGEELTLDYGPEWWNENIVSFPCRCGAENCGFDESKRRDILAKRKAKSK